MRHNVAGRKLGRKSGHRLALFRNQLASLVASERIVTTLSKATPRTRLLPDDLFNVPQNIVVPKDRPVALAAITGTYEGTVALSDLVPPTSYCLTADGHGRPGFVKGSSAITLRADGAATIVDVTGKVQTGGPIARLGQRLIGGVSKMMLDLFFLSLQGKLAASGN